MKPKTKESKQEMYHVYIGLDSFGDRVHVALEALFRGWLDISTDSRLILKEIRRNLRHDTL